MKTLLTAGLTCIALTATPALAGDEGDGLFDPAVVVTEAVLSERGIAENTTSSAGGVIVPIIFLLILAAAVAD